MRDAIILAGGKGTRLASVVADVAKPMARVDGRPFVDFLVTRLQSQGIGRVVLAAGHKAESVFHYYKDRPGIVCLRETEALGTGGAVLNALAALPDISESFFVLNGDSFYPFDLADFDAAPDAPVLMGAVAMEDSGRYGTLTADSAHRVAGFAEKTGKNVPGLVNAGVYRFHKNVFDGMKTEPMSLEKDMFPRLAREGHVVAVPHAGPMLDIGLPETYAAAAKFLEGVA